MKTVLQPILKTVIFLWILFIPSALAWHFDKSQGIVHGSLVDYRIPQIHASAVLLALCGVFFILHMRTIKQSFATLASKYFSWILLSLVCSTLLQTGLSLFQTYSQRSLFGYVPFGEVNLSATGIAKGVSLSGILYKLPYGTTVHPNVLAGFIVISFLIIVHYQKRTHLKSHGLVLMLCFTILICALTQSVSAALALIVGIALWYGWSYQKAILFPIAKTLIILFPIVVSTFLFTPFAYRHSNASIARRSQLQIIAMKMIADHPLRGVGWNNFTLQQENYGYVTSTTRFLQPVHHVFLLLIAELGVIGWIIITGIIILIIRSKPKDLVLIAPLMILASLDHYLLTLTTGRMMVILVIFLLYLDTDMNSPVDLGKIDKSRTSRTQEV